MKHADFVAHESNLPIYTREYKFNWTGKGRVTCQECIHRTAVFNAAVVNLETHMYEVFEEDHPE